MNWYPFFRKWLFRLDPETAHHYLLSSLPYLLPTAFIQRRLNKLPSAALTCFGIKFPNPLGLAAGFDKDGLCIDQWFGLGFGFVELGTVTPLAQEGNPKPRLFRIPEAQALINRMGFNNLGVDHLVERLKSRTVKGIVGVNIGKNRDTLITDAFQDYSIGMEKLYPYADFIAINISSPNTPELRKLQTPNHFGNLLQAIREKDDMLAKLHQKNVPILIKICPNLPEIHLRHIIDMCVVHHIDGLIINNSSIDHTDVMAFKHGHEPGGLSGKAISLLSLNQLKIAKEYAGNKLSIISVGGIISGMDNR